MAKRLSDAQLKQFCDDWKMRDHDDMPIMECLALDLRDERAITNKLPMTADGVPLVPGDTVYYLGPQKVCGCRDVKSVVIDTVERKMVRKFGHMGGHLVYCPHEAFSTREAAEAAKED